MSGIETKLMIRPKEDQLDVRMSQRVGWASPPAEGSGYGFVLALVLGLFSGGILESAGMGVAVFLVSLLAAIPLIIYADGAWREKKLRELESLADRVTSIVAAPLAEVTASEAHTPDRNAEAETRTAPETSTRIDPSLLENDEEPARGRLPSRRRSRDV